MKGEFLLEIGCEEVPASMIGEACGNLQELLEGEVRAAGILGDRRVETFATPRRLIAYCPDLLQAEPDRVDELLGPPRGAAFTPDGKPTEAAKAFASKHRVLVEALQIVRTPKGEYVAALRRLLGRPTAEVLAEIFPRVFTQLRFPRTMYWTSRNGLRFVRPIRWLLALYAGRVVKFDLGGVTSSRYTLGHRALGARAIAVKNFADYRRKLRRALVLIEPGERRAKILCEAKRLLVGKRLILRHDPELLEELINLTEYPTSILGAFDPRFLQLPPEILVTVMRDQQKYFSVLDRAGGLAPHFVAILDLDGDASGIIRTQHERVLRARFQDAEFFWHADLRIKLEDRLNQLAAVVFAERLGSYAAKVARLGQLASWLGKNVSADGRHADIQVLSRAAQVAKCDLTTQMVGEFPELQGIVGGLYARAQGESEPVAQAVYEHYRPGAIDEPSPTTLEGALLALADKIDSVVACLAVGLAPSGSSDPFGLRRAAQGAVKIIVDHKLKLSLPQMLSAAAAIVASQVNDLDTRGAPLVASVHEFLLERARYLFRETQGFAHDEINAVLAADCSNLVDVQARLKAIHKLRPSQDFELLSTAFKRIRNILQQAGNQEVWMARAVEPTQLQAGPERDLFEIFQRLRPRVAELRSHQAYEPALRLIASLRPYVDRFFDRVLVMSEDEALRKNRLTLLAHLLREFSTIADFAEIVPVPPAAAAMPIQEDDHD